MKKALILLLMLALLTGCSNRPAPVGSGSAPAAQTSQFEEGTWHDDIGSDLIIARNENGDYRVDYSIYKLTYMEGASGGAYDISTGALSFSGTDDNGHALAGRIAQKDNHLVVTLTESAYLDCPAGTAFDFYAEKS